MCKASCISCDTFSSCLLWPNTSYKEHTKTSIEHIRSFSNFEKVRKQASSRSETSLLSKNTKPIRNFSNVEKWKRASSISDIAVMAKNMKASIKQIRNFNTVGWVLCEFWILTLQEKGHPSYIYFTMLLYTCVSLFIPCVLAMSVYRYMFFRTIL